MNLFEEKSAEFTRRHIGPNEKETQQMLETIAENSTRDLVEKTIPKDILLPDPLDLPESKSEDVFLKNMQVIAGANKLYRSYIGQGYYNTITPSVILRNVFENPTWYTSYTPYQAEISQGRLESLLNFQTTVSDLTGLELAGASLLDEATAAAEAMAMLYHHVNPRDNARPKFFVDNSVYRQTKDVLITRSGPLGVELVFGDYRQFTPDNSFFAVLVQYPNSEGSIEDYRKLIQATHDADGYVVMATDLLALTLLASPGDLGADVAIGSSQRFGVPLGFGGPHAAFFATRDTFKRGIPGRIIGVSVDAQGNRALRMALQTREQHIKREKATSNICTAQALLANMAAMYAVYHGPEGLKKIASRIHVLARYIEQSVSEFGIEQLNTSYFDTLRFKVQRSAIEQASLEMWMNFHYFDDQTVGIAIDETTSIADARNIISVLLLSKNENPVKLLNVSNEILKDNKTNIPAALQRSSAYLTHPVFNSYHSETKMMRYIKKLENKDLALNTSMISLGSCTMKLNAATEMIPLSWPEFSSIHPFAPLNQAGGYKIIIDELSKYLCAITQFDACSVQPNSGAQGEFAGLNTIMKYHRANGQGHRNVVLIPISAHGTNPASAVMAGMKVVVVKSDEKGQVDVDDLRNKAQQYKDNLGALMITYPSTYGIFEQSIREICQIIHDNGGQVYMDGANMNAQVGYTAPGYIGADICHLNLHKTFAIPHGGGGPGVGPICAKEHLKPYLPGHFLLENSDGAVSAFIYGSSSILLISYAYIVLLGASGLKTATEYAILNANYMKVRLAKYFPILYAGNNGTCAHEFIVDLRPFKASCGIEAEDVAKRLMDYGFHAPTMSFPVPGTIMIEPTESEDKGELDRFCDALINIYKEIQAVQDGTADKVDNVLKNAPHTQQMISSDDWTHPYTRQQAAFPLDYIKENKFWPAVARINNTHGDRNLICSCEPIESYVED